MLTKRVKSVKRDFTLEEVYIELFKRIHLKMELFFENKNS